MLANGTINITRRYHAWAEAVGANCLTHHHITANQPPQDVLTPFSEIAEIRIAPPIQGNNWLLSVGALYLTGLIRQTSQSPGRNRLLEAVTDSSCALAPVPAEYLAIDAEHKAKLNDEVVNPFAARRPHIRVAVPGPTPKPRPPKLVYS